MGIKSFYYSCQTNRIRGASTNFKNKRAKHSTIQPKKPISRDKIESINKLAVIFRETSDEKR